MTTIEIIAALKSHKVALRLSGDQLRLVGETNTLSPVLLEAIRDRKVELISLLKHTSNPAVTGIQPIAQQEDYPATDAQKSIWLLQQLDETGGVYNIVTGLYLKGTLSIEMLNRAFLLCIQKHESLRTVFRELDGSLRMVVSEEISFNISFEDVSSITAIQDHVIQEEKRLTYERIDLEKGPLLKVKLMQIAEQEFAMILVIHHIISDGASVRILLQEVLHNYDTLRKGELIAGELPKVQYKEYTAWLHQRLNGHMGEQGRAFWQQQLAVNVDPLVLPTAYNRPASISFEGAIAKFFPGIHFYPRVLEYCKEHTITPYHFFHASLAILLYKLSGQRILTIGTPVSGRTHFDLQQQIGLFVNTLPLTAHIREEATFAEMLKDVADSMIRSFEFQDYPFARMAEELNIKREAGRNPLFDVMLVLQDTAIGDGRVKLDNQGGFEVHMLDTWLHGTAQVIHRQAPSKFDLTFNLGNTPDNKFYIEIEYAANLFAKENIILFYNAYLHIIAQVLHSPGIAIKSISLVDQDEQYRLLETFNATDAVYPSGKTITMLFEEQVRNTPDNIGLLYEGRSLSYRQLNEAANRMAYYLIEEYHIGPDQLVGIRLERNEWLVVALLAVLKSGGAYVPLDPAYPQERIDYIIADSGCKVLLDDRELQKFLLQEDKYSSADTCVINQSADLAYVIYTSGSTGRPKGVMITHGNVYAFIEWCKEEFKASVYDIVLGVTSICFDLSIFEVFFTLISGKQLRLLENALSIPDYLNSTAPLLLNTVPGVVSHLLSDGIGLSSVNVLNMAGEPIPAGVVSQLDCDRMEVRNLYGPSEDTTYSTIYRLKSADSILIGRPVSNTRVYILNDNDQLQPVGIPGEICISGAGLARGYLNQPELTAAKFIAHPFRSDERMYRTGDIGKWLPDGNIAYLGRKDNQVKIRGYRIELGEIENTLQHYPGVTAAVVTAYAQTDVDKVLVAYITGKTPVDHTALKSHLKATLPDYMVPDAYIQLEELPVLPNGKVNRKALPAPDTTSLVGAGAYVAPSNAIEAKLSEIWQEVLGKERISIKDNFFELGGHSLKTTRLASQIYKVFEVRVALKDLFIHTVLLDQARLIASAQKSAYIGIPVAQEDTSYVLSSAQHRLWILSQLEEGSIAYNMPGVFEFEGALGILALTQAFNTLIVRHESLRTVFRETADGEIRQFILSDAALEFKIVHHDVRGKKYLDIKQLVQAGLTQPFNLSEGPLLRAGLYQTDDNKWIFSYVMHHIISDGWSMEVLIRELLALYHAYQEGKEILLPPLRIQYKDYAVWQQQQLDGPRSLTHKNYWLEQLSGELPLLEMPVDKIRPAIKTYNGAALNSRLDAHVISGLKRLCQSADSTLFMGLLTAVNVLLYRYTGQEDIIVGSPVAGRQHHDLEDQIGFYVNTLALRSHFSGADSFEQILEHIKQVTLDAYEHQYYPFDALIEELPLQRDLSRNALFDVLVVMEHTSGISLVEEGFDALKVNAWDDLHESCKFDLQFSFITGEDTVSLKIVYNTDIHHNSTIVQLSAHMEQLLAAIVAMPTASVSWLSYLSEAEQEKLLNFNAPLHLPEPVTITSSFRQQVLLTPNSPALVFEKKTLTYQQLEEASDKLGCYLQETYQLKPGNLVAIRLERSEWMIIALWGVLKSGAAFVPVDPAYPQDRIDDIIADSGCKLVIDQALLNDYLLTDTSTYTMPSAVNMPDDLAYVIYTSGSTGRPKGVMISHASLHHYIVAIGKEYNIERDERILQVSNFAFDAAIEQIMLSMLHGGCLHVISQSVVTDPEALTSYISGQAITHLHTVPAILQHVDYTLTTSLKRVVSAGEACPVSLVQQIGGNISFYNKYGPTEATISATIYKVTDRNNLSTTVPIGHPLSNSRVYILNEQLGLQPIGVAGEICIGGPSLARGYLNREELTSERFISDPHNPGAQLYRTGDLGKWDAAGNVIYLGRRDDQVKIRGHRIELGEISHVLQTYAGIDTAVVSTIKDNNGDAILVAYLISNTVLDIASIRSWMSSKLPHYMVPAYMLQLEALPLLPNGKVNRKALPAPGVAELTGATTYIAPRNATEEQLLQIWQQVLGRERISVKDNFFELGGHSLKATRLASQIYKTFEVKVSLKDLFTHPVLLDQALLIASARQQAYNVIPVAGVQQDYVLSSAQRRLWVLSRFDESNVAYNMPGVFEFEGALDIPALTYAFNALIERHEALRTIVYETSTGEVRQRILPPAAVGFKIDIHDVRSDNRNTLGQLIQNSLLQPFNLSVGPLLRVSLYHTGEHSWVFSYVMHHIISDGWSMEVLISELLALYDAYAAGNEPTLSPLRIQYKDYAVWQQQQMKEPISLTHRDYWLEQLSGELPVLELPTDKRRPAVKTYNGAGLSRQIDTTLTSGLKRICQSSGSTLFMGLLATVNTLLYHYTGQEDIIVGSPVAGREHSDLEGQIGFYVNTLALRSQFAGTDSFSSLLNYIKQMTLDAYEHQAYPFDTLVEELSLKRDLSRSALFDVMVVLQHQSGISLIENATNTLKIKPYAGMQAASKFDLQFTFTENEEQLKLYINYNSDLFVEDTISQLLHHLEQLLAAIIQNPETAIGSLEYLSVTEQTRLLEHFNATTVPYPLDKTVVDLFTEQVFRTPHHTALLHEGLTLTYQQLDQKANQLAAWLKDVYSVSANDLIGIQLERNEWLVIAMLAVLKSGAAYVPIDPAYPQERIGYIIADSQCKTVLNAAVLNRFQSAAANYSTENIAAAIEPEDLAYIIYTSGSAGRPKGVMITHSNVFAFMEWCREEFSASDYEVVLGVTSICFDLSIFEIFYTLVSGKQLQLLPDALSIPAHLNSELPLLLNTVPSVVSNLLYTGADLSRVTVLNMAGEPIPEQIIRQLDCDRIAVRNLYGPSEDTTYSTIYRIKNGDSVLIGRPISNTRIYILNRQGALQPVGVPGEICISGAGLSHGYLNKPDQTAERFIPHPFITGERLYKTGDLGKWQPDGNIAYLGRIDDQVKIRGYRIEPGEITNVLQRYQGISDGIVTSIKNAAGDNTLVAYLVSATTLNIVDVKRWLGMQVPHYMVPAHFIQLAALPLLPNGKLNRKALPLPEGPETVYVSPRNPVEAKLAEIWQYILEVGQVGMHDNFFELGGHSLKATRLISLIQKEFGVQVNMKDVFMNPTIETVGELIRAGIWLEQPKNNNKEDRILVEI